MMQIFKSFFEENHLFDKRFIVSVSGGVDSMVLLFLAIKYLKKNSFIVLHFNHQTRKECPLEFKMVQDFCRLHALNFHCESLVVNGNNFESNARQLRHAHYLKYLKKYNLDGVLLAHHSDDRIETFFYNLLKGSFLDGLTSLKPINPSLQLFRPLIDVSKADLYKYAKQNKIPYLEDSSNLDITFARNFLRQNLIPLIDSRFVNFKKNLKVKIAIFEELNQFLNTYLQNFMSSKLVLLDYGTLLYKSDFFELPSFLQYKLLKSLGLSLNGFQHFRDLKKSFKASGFCLNFKNLSLYIASDHILISKLSFSQLQDFYFKSLNNPKAIKYTDFKSELHLNGKSLMKHKQIKSVPFYFRGGVGLIIVEGKILKFIVKNS